MSGLYVIYTNINREGWKRTLQTPNRNTFEYALYKIYEYDEPISVITKYQTKKGDCPLVCFHNKIPPTFDLPKAYSLLLKEK